MRASPEAPPEAKKRPSLEKARVETEALCPVIRRTQDPPAQSHNLTLRSLDPEAT